MWHTCRISVSRYEKGKGGNKHYLLHPKEVLNCRLCLWRSCVLVCLLAKRTGSVTGRDFIVRISVERYTCYLGPMMATLGGLGQTSSNEKSRSIDSPLRKNSQRKLLVCFTENCFVLPKNFNSQKKSFRYSFYPLLQWNEWSLPLAETVPGALTTSVLPSTLRLRSSWFQVPSPWCYVKCT